MKGQAISGQVAFAVIFLAMAMMIFRGVTDLEGQERIEEAMLKYRAEEIAGNIELVSDFQNPASVELVLPSEYGFTFYRGSGFPSSHEQSEMRISYSGEAKTVTVNVPLENDNYAGGSNHSFNATRICIREDAVTTVGAMFGGLFASGDSVRDPEDSDGDLESNDVYVQVYKGGCIS
ncbi:MAG: hypothetical protein ABEJ36_04200 [Candidatus Nanosalina sp.]